MKVLGATIIVDELPTDVKDCRFAHGNYEGVACCDFDHDYCELLEKDRCSKIIQLKPVINLKED